MKGMFCNKCGKRMADRSISFRVDIYPTAGGSAIRGDDRLFDYAGMDLCPSCFIEEVERMSAEYKFPPVERTGDKTRYRVL